MIKRLVFVLIVITALVVLGGCQNQQAADSVGAEATEVPVEATSDEAAQDQATEDTTPAAEAESTLAEDRIAQRDAFLQSQVYSEGDIVEGAAPGLVLLGMIAEKASGQTLGTQLYAPAGYLALTVPAGYGEDGTLVGTVFIGRWLSEPQLLAAGYAYEQATQARVAPDLEATMQLIAEME